MRTVREIFTTFCEDRFTEDTQKKWTSYMSRIFSETELFCSFNSDITGEKGDYMEVEGKRNLFVSPNFKEVSLPFENQFVCMEIGEGFEKSVFIREYSPRIITGNVTLRENNIFQIMKCSIPFQIHVESGGLIFTNTEPAIINYYEEALELIIGAVKVLNSLTSTDVMVETPKRTYRKKKGNKAKKEESLISPNRPIYYILGKRIKDEKTLRAHTGSNGNFTISHAFKVRGHWRRVKEGVLGKDRHGNYIVPSYTWVVEHEKGNGELRKKVRVVK